MANDTSSEIYSKNQVAVGIGIPIRKCPEVKGLMSYGLPVIELRGLEFQRTSIPVE